MDKVGAFGSFLDQSQDNIAYLSERFSNQNLTDRKPMVTDYATNKKKMVEHNPTMYTSIERPKTMMKPKRNKMQVISLHEKQKLELQERIKSL